MLLNVVLGPSAVKLPLCQCGRLVGLLLLCTVGHAFVSPYHVNYNFSNVNTTPTFARAGDHKLTVMVSGSGRHSFICTL